MSAFHWSRLTGLVCIHVALVGWGFTCTTALALDFENWKASDDVRLEVAKGNILDFSSLVPQGPAGKYGWALPTPNGVAFEKRQTPQRFFSASFQFAPSNGGFPGKGEAERLATQLARTGYNAVRLQCVEANLMSGRAEDFDFDPEQFDRFHYFLSELKRQGIYTVIDVAYNDNAAYGNVLPHRWVKKYEFRRDLYVSSAAQAHWKKLLSKMLGGRNPYTGMTTLEDPSTLALVLSNEGGVIELMFRSGGAWNAPIPTVYAAPFRDWLRKAYASDAAWRKAWGSEAKPGESLSSKVDLPEKLRTAGARQRDFMRFVVSLEQANYQWMKAYTTELGFKGLTTSNNNWNWLASDVSRSKQAMVDMHAYHAHPSGFVEPGSTVSADSSLSNAASYIRDLSSSRQWGKPFTVTEYGHAFWNGRRRKASALAPAYASLQGWDLLTQFSENSLQLSLAMPQPSRRAAIFPFTISTDPIRRTGERLAALLFARGDVLPAKKRIEIVVDADTEMNRNGGWSQLSETASRLALVSAIGLNFSGQTDATRQSVKGASADVLVDKSKVGYQVFSAIAGKFRGDLKDAGIMNEAAWDDFKRGRFVSDTQELELNAADLSFSANTNRTAVLVSERGGPTVGALTVKTLSVPALVALSSMDGAALPDSRKLLLFILTDAINTGMSFQDEARTKLRTLGTLPAKIQAVTAELQFNRNDKSAFKLYALSQDGRRVETLPLVETPTGLLIQLDTSKLAHGPATIFELTAE